VVLILFSLMESRVWIKTSSKSTTIYREVTYYVTPYMRNYLIPLHYTPWFMASLFSFRLHVGLCCAYEGCYSFHSMNSNLTVLFNQTVFQILSITFLCNLLDSLHLFHHKVFRLDTTFISKNFNHLYISCHLSYWKSRSQGKYFSFGLFFCLVTFLQAHISKNITYFWFLPFTSQ
jgi:hypothetical protein